MTVSKSYSDDCSKTGQNIAINDLYNGAMILYIAHYRSIQILIS